MTRALIVGASRGLGLAIVEELAGRSWDVVGTVRDPAARTPLHELADSSDGRIAVEQLDITDAEQLPSLHDRLAAGAGLDVLFVNAGTTNNPETPIGAVPTSTAPTSTDPVSAPLHRMLRGSQCRTRSAHGAGGLWNGSRASRPVEECDDPPAHPGCARAPNGE